MQFRRIASVLALGLAASLTLGTTAAQAAIVVNDDPAGDVVLVTNKAGKNVPVAKAAAADILTVSTAITGTEEDGLSFTFALGVADLAATKAAHGVFEFEALYNDQADDVAHSMLVKRPADTTLPTKIFVDGKKMKPAKVKKCISNFATNQAIFQTVTRDCLGGTDTFLAVGRLVVANKGATATDTAPAIGQSFVG